MSPEDELISDAITGNLEGAIQLVDVQKVNANYRNKYGETAALFASRFGRLGMVRALILRGADPSIADEDGVTPAMAVSMRGPTMGEEILPLLAIYGADFKAVCNAGETAGSLAQQFNHTHLVAFLNATKNWHPFRMAIGKRLHADLKIMLKTGQIDPNAGCCPLPDLMATATTDAAWPDQPPVCPITTRLARMALAKWSPSTHWLHHGRFQEAVHTLLLVSARLDNLASSPGRRSARRGALLVLPFIVWRMVLGQLLRRDFPAHPPPLRSSRT